MINQTVTLLQTVFLITEAQTSHEPDITVIKTDGTVLFGKRLIFK